MSATDWQRSVDAEVSVQEAGLQELSLQEPGLQDASESVTPPDYSAVNGFPARCPYVVNAACAVVGGCHECRCRHWSSVE